MSTSTYKYEVHIDGFIHKASFDSFYDAVEAIKICMPCIATIEAIETQTNSKAGSSASI